MKRKKEKQYTDEELEIMQEVEEEDKEDFTEALEYPVKDKLLEVRTLGKGAVCITTQNLEDYSVTFISPNHPKPIHLL